MPVLDLAVIVVYVTGTVLFGAWVSRAQTVKDYFVSGRSIPWWAIMGSIVATETSTVTFISVPGYAFAGDFTFLQLVVGYLIGRIVVSVLLLPPYFRGDLLTAYQLLGERFGTALKRLASGLFLITRSLSDGFRLFATGLVLAALLGAMPGVTEGVHGWVPVADPAHALLFVSVLVIGAATIVYTYLGGMTAVIWTDVIQLGIYLVGALAALFVLLAGIPGGWSAVVEAGQAADKFRFFDFTWDVTRSYTFWSGVIGGAFLTTATHGTDQMMVQRYLCSRSVRDARAALLVSGVVVFVQFALFLLIGTMLYVFYAGASQELAAITVDGRVQTDRVFPLFIVDHLPAGLTGLVIAAIFAAAMSTLSSSLNSSSAAAVTDFYVPFTAGRRSDAHYLAVSKVLTATWGLVQVTVALVAIVVSRRVVDEVLGIASFTNGVILGMFLLGTLTRASQTSAIVGVVTGIAVMLGVKLGTAVSWQWYVLVGSLVTLGTGVLASGLIDRSGDARGGSRRA
jgi:solute:Na+ symporter, SSS family